VGCSTTTTARRHDDFDWTPASEQNSVDICMDIVYMIEYARPSL
jgi:hypothetical protein